MSIKTRVARATQRQPDRLDRIVTIVVLLGILVVGPVVIGAQVTPYLDGKPVPLDPLIRSEQLYIARSRSALERLAQSHAALTNVAPAERSAAFRGAARMQREVEAIDALIGEFQRLTPPGRFAGLHRRLTEVMSAYQQLATEGWAYYGDLHQAHIDKIRQTLPVVEEARSQIAELLADMDFQAPPSIVFAPPVEVRPTPTVGGYKFGE